MPRKSVATYTIGMLAESLPDGGFRYWCHDEDVEPDFKRLVFSLVPAD